MCIDFTRRRYIWDNAMQVSKNVLGTVHVSMYSTCSIKPHNMYGTHHRGYVYVYAYMCTMDRYV